ncbi:MAG: phytoene/squalene synthase family protein [Actinobacteria bacterium]|nr:phytoene/squalene synthase family protein [Actinomycetota bacterium]
MATSASAMPSRWRTSPPRRTGLTGEWNAEHPSPRLIPSCRPALSDRATCGGRTSSSRAPVPNLEWACPWCSSPAVSPPSASPAPIRRIAPAPDQEKSDWLGTWGDGFLADLERGRSDDPVCRAVVDTVLRWEIPREHFEAFLHSMRMDLTVTEYPTYEHLYEYVYGSAAVIGLQMVPILEPSDPAAYDYAMKLGVSFQLANFVRDVSEDLDRGRIYLPMDELERFGVSRAVLERREATPEVKAALRHQIDRVKRLEAESRPGIDMLHPSSRDCIDAARVLYCGIADEVANIDYEVFKKRARVSMRERLWVALPAWRRAVRARRRHGAGHVHGINPSYA